MALLKVNFFSRELGFQTAATVILPSYSYFPTGRKDNYDPKAKLQTLYLLHGGMGDDSEYVSHTDIAMYAEQNKLAVVIPNSYNSVYSNLDYGPRVWDYISKELPAFCRAMFPLSEKPEDTFVAGLSMGGFGTLKWVIKEPEQFAAALCMSGMTINPKSLEGMMKAAKDSGFISNEIAGIGMENTLKNEMDPNNNLWDLAKRNVEEGKKLPKLFITCGDQDFILPGARETKDYLQEIGYDVFYEEVPGYAHEWDFWNISLRKAIYEWLPLKRDLVYPEN